ncbi:MAG TPA: YjfB family protein [Deltaproteobacteria bacterium]|nr:YjfB family protein [Deltaproteobacteria bacterium]HQI80177.1 YjfB family protein [Deltaproteobacteria bacterium]
MDPIRGTNVSLEMALIAAKAQEIQDKVSLAGTKLAIDTQRMEGQELVKMMESLGTIIDTYA